MLLRHPHELVALEGFANSAAGSGVIRNFENRVADLDDASRTYKVPIEARNRDVFARRPGSDGVTLLLHRTDPLERKEAYRAVRPTVMLPVILAVAEDPE